MKLYLEVTVQVLHQIVLENAEHIWHGIIGITTNLYVFLCVCVCLFSEVKQFEHWTPI